MSQHESVVELVEWEIADLEVLDDDRALVRAFRLLAQVHGTAGRYADAAGTGRHRFLFLVQETPMFALQVMSSIAERLRAATGSLPPASR
jgi:CRP-like cAMP-binding protein